MKNLIAASALALSLSTSVLASTIPTPCRPTPTNPYCGMDMQTITTADLMQTGIVKFDR